MILLDEEGKAIEAQIPQRWIGTCRPRLKEDSVYYIKFFQVVSAKTSFCTVDHAYMIRFTGHTQITEIKLVPVAFPLYACTPVPFSVLHDRLHITEYTSGQGIKPLRNVYITNGKEDAVVALWEREAENFDANRYMNMASQGPVAFLFIAMTSRMFEVT